MGNNNDKQQVNKNNGINTNKNTNISNSKNYQSSNQRIIFTYNSKTDLPTNKNSNINQTSKVIPSKPKTTSNITNNVINNINSNKSINPQKNINNNIKINSNKNIPTIIDKTNNKNSSINNQIVKNNYYKNNKETNNNISIKFINNKDKINLNHNIEEKKVSQNHINQKPYIQQSSDYHSNNKEYYDEEEYEEDDYEEEGEEEDDDEYYDDEEDYDDEGYYEDKYYYNNNNYNNQDNYHQNKSIEDIYQFTNSFYFTKMVDRTIDPNPYNDINDNIINVLMIAEKPSIARTISKILSKNQNLIDKTKELGWCHYSFKGKFRDKKANFIVSAVSGHIYQTEFLRKHQNYDIDPIELFDVPLVKKETNEDAFLNIDWLKQIAQNQDILCLWLDCDREGENICYEVIYNVLPYMNQKEYQQIYRAIFSSLTKNDIINSFENISNYPDNNLSLSVDARQVIDLKIGVSLTRFLTSNLLPLLPENEIYNNCISYGPCQTPTLYFCVKRAREIESNNSKYYKINFTLKISNNLKVELYIDGEFTLKQAKLLKQSLEELNYLKINNISKEERKKPHPLGLNTVNLLKFSSIYLNNSPNTTMKIAQNLYMGGYITYPRTETTAYSSSFDFKNNLKNLNKYIHIEDIINNFDENIDIINAGGVDAGDHPPITPSRTPKKGKLNKSESDLYDLICDYYLASLSPDLEYKNIKYQFLINYNKYTATCSVIEKEGFSKYFPFHEKKFIDKNKILKSNQNYEIINVNYEEYKKDDYLTEAELIEEMEKNHIGTDASMSVHIENIVKRGYVEVDDENGRRLIPTNLGRALIEALENVEPDIILPKNRAKIEEYVSELAQGKKEYKEVLDYALEFYKNKYINVTENFDIILQVFGKYFELIEEEF